MADFHWLNKQARDKRSKNIISSKVKKWHKDAYQGKFSIGKRLFFVDLDNYRIWLRECSSYSSVDMYTGIFKQKLHFLRPEFSGKGAKLIIDGGACEGYYTLKVKENNPSCRIIAIEPNPVAYELLKRNIKANSLKNVVLVNSALSAKETQLPFEFVEQVNSVGGTNVRIIKRFWLREDMIKKTTVKAISLESLCNKYGVKDIDILKLDIQGLEMEVLRSSERLLKRIKKIVVEWHSDFIREEVKKFLKYHKFNLVLEHRFGPLFGENIFLGDLYFINRR